MTDDEEDAELIRVIGATLRRVREDRGLSQAKFSILSGLPQATISRIELGALERPTVTILARHARACGYRLFVGIVKRS